MAELLGMVDEKQEHTIKEPVLLEATSLVRRKKIRIQITPASPGQGIVFIREDLGGAQVRASLENAISVSNLIFNCMALKNGKGEIFIPEHILAALYMAHIDNAFVIINDRFFPSLPLSIYPYLDQIRKVGLVSQEKPCSLWLVREPKEIEWQGRRISVEPKNELEIDYTIDFKEPLIGTQRFIISDNFYQWLNSIAFARAFNIFKWMPEFLLQKATENFVIVRRGKILNKGKNSIRYEGTEPVRHKIIDFCGALALLGGRIKGKFTVFKSGHTFDVMALRNLIESGYLVAEKV